MTGAAAALERLARLHPKVIDLSLGRMMRLLRALGRPHLALPPVVHVAGTNGKGSVIAFMQAALAQAGYRVHAYTSPHLLRFHERIVLDGQAIADDRLAALLDECERANGGQAITFFEATTAAALLAFARHPGDILLLETGLGGRLDATNVVPRPLLTVVTPVSLDHQHFLGDTLAAIAAEKAGIVKPGVPVAIAPQAAPALAVLEARARNCGAPVALAGRDFSYEEGAAGFTVIDGAARRALPPPALAGPHQLWNATLAVAALARLPGFRLPDAAVARGIAGARWPARLQRLAGGRLAALAGGEVELWLDGGHNPAAGAALAAAAGRWRDRPLDLVVAMMANKDAPGFVAPLAPLARRAAAIAIPGENGGENGGLPAAAMRAALAAAGIEALQAEGVEHAIQALARRGRGPARVLICGSLYLAGRVLAADRTGGDSPA